MKADDARHGATDRRWYASHLLAALRKPQADYTDRQLAADALRHLGLGTIHRPLRGYSGFVVWSGFGFLTVGDLCHTYQEWLDRAVDLLPEPGVAEQVHAIARQLLAEANGEEAL